MTIREGFNGRLRPKPVSASTKALIEWYASRTHVDWRAEHEEAMRKLRKSRRPKAAVGSRVPDSWENPDEYMPPRIEVG